MFEGLIQKITEHDTYGPAMQQAVAEGADLVLNFHSHQGNERFCVSICARELSPIKILISEKDPLDELVHIEGMAQSEEDFEPLCAAFSNALCAHYGLKEPFELYFQGEPRDIE